MRASLISPLGNGQHCPAPCGPCCFLVLSKIAKNKTFERLLEDDWSENEEFFSRKSSVLSKVLFLAIVPFVRIQ